MHNSNEHEYSDNDLSIYLDTLRDEVEQIVYETLTIKHIVDAVEDKLPQDLYAGFKEGIVLYIVETIREKYLQRDE